MLLGGAVSANADPAPVPVTYSVDCSAKVGGDGVQAPWRSLGAVNAHGAFAPGDRILFKRGTTCKGKLSARGSGAAGAPIVIGVYGDSKKARPTIAGGGTGMETATITLRNQAWVVLQDLHVTNSSTAKSSGMFRSGVLLLNDRAGMLPGVTVQRLKIDHVVSRLLYAKGHDARDWGGISVHTVDRGSGDGYDGLRILHNTVSGVGRTGIVTSNREYPDGLDRGLRIAYNMVAKSRGDGVIMRGAQLASVDHNRVKDNSNMWPCKECLRVKGMGANAGIWPTMSSDSVIEYNNVSGTNVGHGDGEGIDLDIGAERMTVQYNYLHDNGGGGVLFCGSVASTVRFNILEDNKKSAFAFIGSIPAKDSRIYNNTVYASARAKARIVRYFNGAHGSGITFSNNLLYNYGLADYLWPTKTVKTAANTLIGKHGKGRPHDSRTSRADPKLKAPGRGTDTFSSLGGYRPKHPSSFRHGIAIPSAVTHDFFGKKIDPRKPPRGAAG